MTRTLKVVVFIAVLMITVLGISIYANTLLTRSASEMEQHIRQIENSATKDNWQEARKVISGMQNDWTSTKKTWAVLIDHMEIDNVENALTRLEKFIDTGEKASTMAEIAMLKQYVRNIPSMGSLRIENIF